MLHGPHPPPGTPPALHSCSSGTFPPNNSQGIICPVNTSCHKTESTAGVSHSGQEGTAEGTASRPEPCVRSQPLSILLLQKKWSSHTAPSSRQSPDPSPCRSTPFLPPCLSFPLTHTSSPRGSPANPGHRCPTADRHRHGPRGRIPTDAIAPQMGTLSPLAPMHTGRGLTRQSCSGGLGLIIPKGRRDGDGDGDRDGGMLDSCRSLPVLPHPRRWLRRTHPSLAAFTSQKYCSTEPAPSGSTAPPPRLAGRRRISPEPALLRSAPQRGAGTPRVPARCPRSGPSSPRCPQVLSCHRRPSHVTHLRPMPLLRAPSPSAALLLKDGGEGWNCRRKGAPMGGTAPGSGAWRGHTASPATPSPQLVGPEAAHTTPLPSLHGAAVLCASSSGGDSAGTAAEVPHGLAEALHLRHSPGTIKQPVWVFISPRPFHLLSPFHVSTFFSLQAAVHADEAPARSQPSPRACC